MNVVTALFLLNEVKKLSLQVDTVKRNLSTILNCSYYYIIFEIQELKAPFSKKRVSLNVFSNFFLSKMFKNKFMLLVFLCANKLYIKEILTFINFALNTIVIIFIKLEYEYITFIRKTHGLVVFFYLFINCNYFCIISSPSLMFLLGQSR